MFVLLCLSLPAGGYIINSNMSLSHEQLILGQVHPESRGAVQLFHRGLKSILHPSFPESSKVWDEGVHVLLFAAPVVVKEFLGFSPAEPMFVHTVPDTLQPLQEKWMSDSKPQNSSSVFQ